MLNNREDKLLAVPDVRKNRKERSFRTMAGMMALCAALSGGFGYLGGTLSADGKAGESAPAVSASSSESVTAMTASAVGYADTLTIAQVAAACADTVVEITTESTVTDRFLRQYVTEGAGSGVIVSEDGYIITNDHVITGASRIVVTTRSGEEYEAELIGTDPQTDVAVIKVEADDLSAAAMGDSSSLQVGQTAIAIGNPLGELGGTVTDGIISALSREITLGGEEMTLLQTNAAINPGNSGGGLFDDHGRLIGIVNAKSSGTGIEGIGFAIPIDTARAVAMDLVQYGVVTGRVQLGLGLADVQDQYTAMQMGVTRAGVYVVSVSGAAAEAGFEQGDLITAVDKTEITTSAEVKEIIRKHRVGDTLSFTVIRDGRSGELTVTLRQAEASAA